MKKIDPRKSGKKPIFEFPALIVPPWLHPTARNSRHVILWSWAIIWTYYHIFLRFVTVKIFWPSLTISLKTFILPGHANYCIFFAGEISRHASFFTLEKIDHNSLTTVPQETFDLAKCCCACRDASSVRLLDIWQTIRSRCQLFVRLMILIAFFFVRQYQRRIYSLSIRYSYS